MRKQQNPANSRIVGSRASAIAMSALFLAMAGCQVKAIGSKAGSKDIKVTLPTPVPPSNQAPTLTSVSTLATATEDTAFTIGYSDLAAAADEADADGDAISFRVEAVSSGTLTKGGSAVTAGSSTLASGESLVWTPAANANGNLSAFTIRAYDGTDASSSAIPVVVTTSAVNDTPTLTAVSTLTGATEDTAFAISYAALAAAANEADVDGDALSFRVESVSTGSLTKGGSAVTAGTTLLSSGEDLIWTPATDAMGNLNAFTIRAYDGAVASATAVQVVVSVSGANDPPTLTTISNLTGATEDTAYTISYAALATAANEADSDGDAISFRIEAVSSGTLTKAGSAVTAGTTLLSSGETLVWTPAANANGTLNAFTVKAYDGNSASATAIQVAVVTTAVNDVPTLSTISTLTGATEDTAFTITYATLAAAANEADVDGDALSFRVEAVSSGTLTKGGSAVTAGTTTIASGESLVWTPAANATGDQNAFTVKAHDGTAASATAIQVVVNLSGTNDAPTLTTISTLATATEDTAFTISYDDLAGAANETDADGDTISFRVEAVSTGTLTKGGTAVTAGTTLLSSGESLVWTPASNATGSLNAFTVRAHDGSLASASAVQVVVSTNAVNDVPTLGSISALTGAFEDTAFTITYAALAAAADEADGDGDTLSFRIEAVSTGTLTKGGTAVTAGTTTLASGESLVWTPALNANGNLNAFTVVARDGTSTSASPVQVVVTTSAVNDTPTLSTISTLTGASEDTPFTISYAALAAAADEADVDGDALSFRVEAVSTGTLTKGGVAVTAGTTTLASGESLVWTPASNVTGNQNAFTVKAHDGTVASATTIQVVVDVNGDNDAPTLSSISTLATATEDTAFTISYATLAAAANEADADGDAISFRVEAVSTGTLTKGGVAVTAGSTLLSSGESLVWTPALNANGNLNAFTVKAYDGSAASASAVQVVVTTSPGNDIPTLTTISTLTGATEDTAFTVTYAALAAAADEADIDGDALSFRVEAVSSGTLTKGGTAVTPGTTLLSSGQTLVWTPAANANGNLNAFTVVAYDGTSPSSSAVQVVINAAAVADAPTLSTISTLTGASEDTAFTISYDDLASAANEADVDGDTLSFRVEAVSTGTLTKGGSAVTAGTTLLSSGESLVWTPALNANGTLNAFTVKAWDGGLASSTAIQVQVSVGDANDPPTLTTIANLTGATEDTLYSVTYAALAAAANEADPEGDPISFRVEAVSSGTLIKGGSAVTPGTTLLSSGETLSWTPDANANDNLNAFTVKAYDGSSASSTAIQVVVVTAAVADAPTLSTINTLVGGPEDTPVTITYADLATAANEADADGDSISFRVEAVSTGTLTKGGSAVTAGTTLLSSGESLVWTPALTANGNLNAFTVKAYDGALASSTAIQVVVNIGATNSAPTLTSVSTLATATEDTAFTISYATLAAAANEADPESDPISFRVESVTSGNLTKGGTAVTDGVTLLSSGENWVWTPGNNANGNLNAFTIRAYDGSLASATAIQVVVNTSAVNDAPTLSTISTLATASEDTAFTISYATLLAASNASDIEGDTISFRVQAVSTGTLTKGGSAVTAGSTLLSSGESLVWTPAANANGNLNAFTVRAYDGALASGSDVQVVVTTSTANDAPTLTTISTLATVTEDTAFTISYATLAGAADEADLDGDAISFRVEAVSSGTLTKGGSAVTAGTTLLSSGESLVWTPAANANGNLNAFTVKAYDGALASASAIQVVVTTSPVNDIPTLSTISTLTGATEDTAFTISYATLAAAANEADIDGDALSFRVEAVSTGTLTKGGSAVTAGTTLLSSGENLVWTPASNANGNLNAFTVVAYDGTAPSSSAIQVVVTVTGANDVPTLTTISALATATEDTAFTISYATLAGAADEADADGDAISFRVEAVSSGTLTKGGTAVTAGTTTLSSGESLVWTPAANANGNLNAFTVKAYDGAAASTSAIQVVVTTSAVNDAPTLAAVSTLTGATEDTAFTISYATLAGAADEADIDGDTLSFRVEAVSTGTLTKGGSAVTAGSTLLSSGESLVWTPAAGANGSLNAFTVKAYDGALASSSAIQVVVTTSAVNDAPTLTAISTLATATEDTAFTISYATLADAADEADGDGDTLSFRIEAVSTGTLTKGGSAVTAGTTLLSSGESLVWTPAANANGNLNAFTVKAYDGALASVTAIQVVVTTSAVNDVPTLSTISTLTGATEDTAFTISYATLASAANEADVDGDTLSFRIEAVSSGTLTKGGSAVTAGTTTIASSESLVWTPAANATGDQNAFTVKVYDGTAASATAIQVVVNLSGANDAPTLTTISTLATATEDTAFTISYASLAAAANEADVDGDAISFRVEAVSTGTLTKGGTAVTAGTTLLSNGESLLWTPAANANGDLNAFTVKAYDGALASASAVQVVVTTSAVNDIPTLTTISTLATATEDTAFTISYATLAGAADEADADGNAISFRVEAVSTGTLTKSGSPVTAGTTLLSSGESLVWTPASNANGTLNAFTVKAYDGTAASSSAIQVVVTTTAVNDAPTLTTISTLTGAHEDIPFTISYATLAGAANEADVEGDTLSFRVEAVSTGTLTKGGSAVTAGTTLLSSGESLVWTPALGQTGNLNAFTVKAYDGALASATAIQVVVDTAVNTAPTISLISDQTLNYQTASSAIAITVGDAESAVASLTMSGSSSNTTLIPNANIVFGGSGANRTVTITPANGQVGTANITVTVSDGDLTASDTFQVVVIPRVDLESPIELVANGLGSNTSAVTWERSKSFMDTTDYDGTVTYYFEITAYNSHASNTYAVELVNSSGVAVATISVPPNNYDRYRSAAFTPTAGLSHYRIKTPATAAAGNIEVLTGRILVKQVGATKTRLYFPLLSYRGAINSDLAAGGVVDVSTQTTYVVNSGVYREAHPYFQKDESAYAQIASGNAWRLEATLKSDNASATASTALFNATANTQVSGAEVSTTSTSGDTLMVDFANSATNFTDLANFEARIKTSNATYQAGLAKANLSVKLENLSKGRIYHRVKQAKGYSAAVATWVESRVLYDLSQFSNPRVYFEGTSSQATTGSYQLETMGTLDTGDTSTAVPGTLITTSATKTRTRVGPLALTSGDRYTTRLNWTSGTVRTHGSFLVTDFGYDTSGSNVAPTLSSINTLAGAVQGMAYTISYATLAAAANEYDSNGDAISFRVEAVSTGTLTKGGSAVTAGSTLLSSGESLVWTPASNGSAVNAFTVKAYDGALASATAVQVQVATSANTAPTISLISDQTLNYETASAAIPITVGDAETAVASLTLSGSSSNTTLIPNANIVFGGSGASRTVTVTPAAGQTGTANITVTVTDSGGLAASDTFQVVVIPRIDLEQAIDMVGKGIGSNTVTKIFERTKTYLDTTDFDGTVTYYFEINLENADASTYTYELVNAAGTTVASVTSPQSTQLSRIRSAAFTPTAGLSHYRLKMPATATVNRTVVWSARIIVKQVGATKTRLYYPLVSNRNSGHQDDLTTNGTTDEIGSTTYTQNQNFRYLVFEKNESTYSQIASGTPWRFEGTLAGFNATYTTSLALFNKTTDAMVSGAELTATNQQGTFYVDFSNSTTNFTDLNEFEARIKTSNATYWANVYKANLSVKLTNLTKGRIYQLIRSSDYQNSAAWLAATHRFHWDPANYSNPQVYFDVSGKVEAANAGTVQLESMGPTDASTLTHTAIVPGTLFTPTTTRTRMRSEALSLTSGDRYNSRVYWNSSAIHHAGSFMVMDFGYDSTASNVAPTLSVVTPLTGANENIAYTIPYATLAAAANEHDADGDALSFRIEAVSTGTLTKGGSAVTAGTTTIAAGESLVWTPPTNTSGTLNAFTIKAYDGTLASSTAIQVQVVTAPANNAPTISNISDLSTPYQTATSAIAFTVGDTETAAASLTLTKASSNTTLVPTANIVFGGSGTNRTVTVTPASGQYGSATITVTVTDGGGLTASDTFVLTVLPRIDIEHPIDMLGSGLSSGTGAVTWARSKTYMDTTDFDGTVTYYFEASVWNHHASTTYTVDLVNSSGTVLTSLSFVPAADGYTRMRSAAFTPTAGLSYYRVKTPATAAAGNLEVASARIIVRQVGATKTRLYFPLNGLRALDSGDAPSLGSIAWTTGTTYTQTYPYMHSLFEKDESAYSQIASGNPWRLEATFTTTNAAAAAYVALFNKTTNSMVSGAEITTSTTTGDTFYVDFPNSATNFTDLHVFENRIKNASGAGSTNLHKSNLSVKLDNLSKGRIFNRVKPGEYYAGTPWNGAEARFLWDPTRYSNSKVSLDSSLWVTTPGIGSLSLQTMGTLDTGTTSSGSVPGSTYTPSTTRGRERSRALSSLTSGDRYTVRVNSTAATTYHGGSFMVMDFGYDSSAANVAPTLTDVDPISGATEDTAFTISYATLAAAANEHDWDGDTLSFRIESVSSGTLTKGGSAVVAGTTTLASGESLVWTPASNANGTLNAFTIKAYDGTAASSTATQVQVAVASVNDAAPTLTTISTLTGATEDTPFTISYADLAAAADEADVDGDAILFRVEAVSSGTLTKGGSAVTAGTTTITTGESLVWTPAANANGTLAAFTVKAYDGTAASASAVQVNVTTAAVNDPPTIVAIADQITNFNTATGAITVTIGDVETAAASLILTKASSNTTLVPTANIVFGGSGTSRTVTITPVTGQSGTANITVTVDDGTTTTSDIFQLTVYPRIDLEVPIEMLGVGVGSATAVATQFNRSKTFLDTGDFDGTVSYYFEINAYNGHASNTYAVDLVNAAGTAVASINVPPNAAAGYKRYRSTAFTPTSGLSHYFVKMPMTAAANDVTVGMARILVHQVGATKTRLYFPLLGYRSYSNADTTTSGSPEYGVLTSYGKSFTESYALFHKDESAYSQIASGTPWRFEVNMSSANAAATPSVALFNQTTGTMVTGSELTGSNTNNTYYVDLANNATNFTDLNEFEARYKTSNASYNTIVFSARLSVKLTNLSKGRVYHRLRNGWLVTADGTQGADGRTLYESSRYINPTAYFEVTGSNSVASGGTVELQTMGVNDTGTAGTYITNSRLTPSTTRGRTRSAALSLTSGDRYTLFWDWTSGTMTVSPSFLVIDFGP